MSHHSESLEHDLAQDSASPNPLRGLDLLSEGGQVVSTETLWRDQAVLIAFVRHFG